ncbi:hypothetical protein [Bacillus tropicus]|uniref:hypothetical protein n=1 Tax=Bacillus tropicus TaxID=2026188 RepID=UPI003D1B003B
MDYVTILSFANTLVIGAFLTTYFKTKGKNQADIEDSQEISMLKELGKNIATKQDIQEITRLQEVIKADFQLKMEQQKSQLSRISKEFELYVVKKHEHYPELYKNIELCIGKVKGLRGVIRSIDFQNVNKEDINNYMKEKLFTESDKEYICSNWDNNKQQAILSLKRILQYVDYNEAHEYYATAHNFYFLHRLFFSEEVSDKSRELLDKIYALWVNYDPDFTFLGDPDLVSNLNEENEILKNEIDELKNELFILLQGELRAGSAS